MALTVESLTLELGKALEPLEQRLRGGEINVLFSELGLPASGAVLVAQPVITAIRDVADELSNLPPVLTELAAAIEAEDAVRIGSAVARAVPIVRATVVAIDVLSTRIDSIAAAAGSGQAEVEAFAAELPERLFGFVLASYLDGEQPMIGQLFTLFGVIEVSSQPATAATPAHVRRALRLDRLAALVQDPVDILEELYGWGTAGFDWDLLLKRLATLLGRVSNFAFVQPGPPPVLRIAIVDVGPTADPIPGVQAVLRFGAGDGLDLALPVGETAALIAKAEQALEASAAIALLPPADLRVTPPGVEVSGKLRAGIEAPRAAGAPRIVVLGVAGGSRIEAQKLRFAVGADLEWSVAQGRADGAFVAELAVEGGKIVLSLAGADGFLTTILPGGRPIELEAGLLIGWSSSTGLHFEGNAAAEIDIPVDFDLGPIKIQLLHIGLAPQGDGLALELSGSVGAQLGPFGLAVDRIGTNALLSFPAGGGNLGPADLTLAFKPPTGIGLTLDAGIVRGGGFIRFDPDKGEYAGVLELALGPVSIKAVAILTTRLPGGREGWALLLLVYSEFSAVQLGFGFTLNGVGGILGLQHGVSTAELQAGLRSGALDSVLFPANPVASAPLLLGQLRLVFPIVPRALTLGPALKLGWSTPPIVTLSLALVIQIDDVLGTGSAQPQISRIVLIGQLKVQLPPATGADVPDLLKLLVDIVGSYETREEALSIDARLRDSHIAGLPLTGSLVVRARFGAQPSLILAVGGFHPRFRDLPPGLPAQDRVGFELRYDIVTVRVAGYTAITSNSFQIGADAHLKAEGGGFKVQVNLGFDALFLFEPVFHFEIDFRVSGAISWKGHNLASVKVSGVLTGPGRWEVSGHASFGILWWDVNIDFEIGWGDSPAQALPSVAVGAQLVAALANQSNWSAELPTGGAALVTLRKVVTNGSVPAHPLGNVTVLQNVVPLGIDIDRVGTSRPSDGRRFDISSVEVAGRLIPLPEFRDEHFARGRYLDLEPDEKLSTPSFERFRAGVAISSSAYTVAVDQVAFEPELETVYVGEEVENGRSTIPRFILTAQARFGAASHSALRRDDRLLPDDLVTRIEVAEPAFMTVDAGLEVRGAPVASYTEASQRAKRDGTMAAEAVELVGAR